MVKIHVKFAFDKFLNIKIWQNRRVARYRNADTKFHKKLEHFQKISCTKCFKEEIKLDIPVKKPSYIVKYLFF